MRQRHWIDAPKIWQRWPWNPRARVLTPDKALHPALPTVLSMWELGENSILVGKHFKLLRDSNTLSSSNLRFIL